MAAALSAARGRLPPPRSPLHPPDPLLLPARPPLLDAAVLGRLPLVPLAVAATRAAVLAAPRSAGRHDLRQHVLGRLVGGRILLEPPLRQPAPAARGGAGGKPGGDAARAGAASPGC